MGFVQQKSIPASQALYFVLMQENLSRFLAVTFTLISLTVNINIFFALIYQKFDIHRIRMYNTSTSGIVSQSEGPSDITQLSQEYAKDKKSSTSNTNQNNEGKSISSFQRSQEISDEEITRDPIQMEHSNRIKNMELKQLKQVHSHSWDDFSLQEMKIEDNQDIQNRQLFFEQSQKKKLKQSQENQQVILEDKNFVIIKQNNNQKPDTKKQLLLKLVSSIHGKCDFQICLQQFDERTQATLDSSLELQIVDKQESLSNLNHQQLQEIQNNQLLNIPNIENEFKVQVHEQEENNVSQEMRWKIISARYFKHFQQAAEQRKLIIEPLNYKFQYLVKSQSKQGFDLKIYKQLKEFQQEFQEELNQIVVLTYQYENHDEARQIAQLLKHPTMIKLFNKAFQTQNVIIDHMQMEKKLTVCAIFYNNFDIPIKYLQELFIKIILNEKFIKLLVYNETLCFDHEPDIQYLYGQIQKIQPADIRIDFIEKPPLIKKYQIEANYKMWILTNDDLVDRLHITAQEVKNRFYFQTTLKLRELKQQKLWRLYLREQYQKYKEVDQSDDQNEIIITLKGDRQYVELLYDDIPSQLSKLQFQQLLCKYESNHKFFEFICQYPRMLTMQKDFTETIGKFNFLYIGLIGSDNIGNKIQFEIISNGIQNLKDLEESIKRNIIVPLSDEAYINQFLLFSNPQQLELFKQEYKVLNDQNITEFSDVKKSEIIQNAILQIKNIINTPRFRGEIQLQKKQWSFLERECQKDLEIINCDYYSLFNIMHGQEQELDLACAKKNDKTIIIRKGKICNQKCDLFINPIIKNNHVNNKANQVMATSIAEDLACLLGNQFRVFMYNFMDSQRQEDYYSDKKQPIKHIMNIVIKVDSKNYLERMEKHIKDIFKYAQEKQLNSIIFPKLGLHQEIAQQTIVERIIQEIDNQNCVKSVTLLSDNFDQVKIFIKALQRKTYQQSYKFMYKQGNEWMNFGPEMSQKIWGLYYKANENINLIDFPITTQPGTHIVDSVTSLVTDKATKQCSKIKEEQGFYYIFEKLIDHDSMKWINFNHDISRKKYEICLKQFEFEVHNNQITSPKAQIKCIKISQNDHFMFQYLIKDPPDEIENLNQANMKSDIVTLVISSNSQTNLNKAKESTYSLLQKNYTKLNVTINQLSFDQYLQFRNLVLKKAIEYSGEMRQGQQITIIGFKNKLDQLRLQLESQEFNCQCNQVQKIAQCQEETLE